MALRATHVASGTDITIGPLIDPKSQAVLDEIYQHCGVGVLECREHDDHPDLAHLRDPTDGRVHGAWVYVRKSRNKTLWQIVHQGGIGREFRTHEIPIGKSNQHQWQQDYYERAAQYAGYATAQEVPLSTDTRLDLTITGPAGVFGVEIQHSYLSVPRVRARTQKAKKAGITSIWSTDQDNPDWAFKVPHVETNALPDGVRPRGSWTVTTGPRRVIRARCSSDNFQRCPTPGRRNFCGGWHALFRPIDRLVVDDIAEQVPAGALVPLDTRTKQGIILVSPADQQLWYTEFADQIPRPRPELNPANRCNYQPHLTHEPARLIEPPLHRPRPCPTCGEQSWAIIGQRCLRCRS